MNGSSPSMTSVEIGENSLRSFHEQSSVTLKVLSNRARKREQHDEAMRLMLTYDEMMKKKKRSLSLIGRKRFSGLKTNNLVTGYVYVTVEKQIEDKWCYALFYIAFFLVH